MPSRPPAGWASHWKFIVKPRAAMMRRAQTVKSRHVKTGKENMRANAVEIAKRGAKPTAKFEVVGKAPAPIKKLNLGGIAASSSAKKSKDHPIMPVSAESLEFLEQFRWLEPNRDFLRPKRSSRKALATALERRSRKSERHLRLRAARFWQSPPIDPPRLKLKS